MSDCKISIFFTLHCTYFSLLPSIMDVWMKEKDFQEGGKNRDLNLPIAFITHANYSSRMDLRLWIRRESLLYVVLLSSLAPFRSHFQLVWHKWRETHCRQPKDVLWVWAFEISIPGLDKEPLFLVNKVLRIQLWIPLVMWTLLSFTCRQAVTDSVTHWKSTCMDKHWQHFPHTCHGSE